MTELPPKSSPKSSDAAPAPAPGDRTEIASYARMVGLLGLALVLGLGGWASLTKVSGAVMAHGSLVNASYAKKVQHPNGGRVKALFVQEGQKVKMGQKLIELDDAQVSAAYSITESDLLQLEARERRLIAEQAVATGGSGANALDPRPDDSPEMIVQLENERRLMKARRQLRESQKAQISQQMAGQDTQIGGMQDMTASRQRQIGLVEDELTGVKKLYDEGYAPISSLKALQRQKEALAGERGQITSEAAGARNRIAELRMQALQIDAQHLQEVLADLRDVETKKAELVQKAAAQRDELGHTEILAPQDGYVHELSVHAVGGVVASGEQIMLIVPDNDVLTVEAKVEPQSITELRVGQLATVKFTGLNPRTAPQLDGRVDRISPDLVQDNRTGIAYYVVRISLGKEQLARLNDVKLVPGMPVEADMKTSDRTVLSYLLKPLGEQLDHAFRER